MSTPPPFKTTLDFYDQTASTFIESTSGLDMTAFYDKFLSYIPKGGHILDAGCGSARDALAFSRMGFAITAFDGSAEMARLSTEVTGIQVQHLRFDEIAWTCTFDGVWACASLLHVPLAKLPSIIVRLQRVLEDRGVMYASFKKGRGEVWRHGRLFVSFELEEAIEFFLSSGGWVLLEAWESTDIRPQRRDESWINLLLRRDYSLGTTLQKYASLPEM